MITLTALLLVTDGAAAVDPGLQVVNTISDLGPTGILILLFLWFARWLPKYLERQQEREDQRLKENQTREDIRLKAFQDELQAEREQCAKDFNRLYEQANAHHADLIRVLGEKK